MAKGLFSTYCCSWEFGKGVLIHNTVVVVKPSLSLLWCFHKDIARACFNKVQQCPMTWQQMSMAYQLSQKVNTLGKRLCEIFKLEN